MQDIENTNEWVNWIEEAVDRKHLKFYEYEEFNNIQHIGTGGFGYVYSANWKNSGKLVALKSFTSLAMKEIIRELKNQREVDFHDNIIRCYGITKLESDHNKYRLVMEYADGGTLRSYLKENFNKLTWDDKYNMASQLSCAVSCLHNVKILHRDLHSCNILVRNNTIKLADFGLSKRIGTSSNLQSKLFGVIPYVDPKSFSKQRNNNNQSTQMFSLNEKSDIYSIGVLFWEISSGKPPFYAEEYDVGLAIEISQGLREIVVPDTPEEYVKIYTKCWDGEPDNRPTIDQVVYWLNAIITKSDVIIENHQISNEQELNETSLSTNSSELQGDLYQLIQNFDKMNTKEIDSTVSQTDENGIVTERTPDGNGITTVKVTITKRDPSGKVIDTNTKTYTEKTGDVKTGSSTRQIEMQTTIETMIETDENGIVTETVTERTPDGNGKTITKVTTIKKDTKGNVIESNTETKESFTEPEVIKTSSKFGSSIIGPSIYQQGLEKSKKEPEIIKTSSKFGSSIIGPSIYQQGLDKLKKEKK